ncbi:MAG TPA: hypothetical protein VFZ21_14585 [Gemmatimonadaceae bacterium]|jgi:hypothetical protein|nr:hypothetical protein [Gemmatimonadaceae bacterium]
MPPRHIATFLLALAITPAFSACNAIKRTFGVDAPRTQTTSPYGHWVLATPIDSTAFAGATQVELVLAPGSFNLTAVYPDRPQLAIDGSAQLADGGLLTLVPATGEAEGTKVGFPAGQPFTRMASASGATLVLAPPSARVPLPSSVWHRIEVAREAGLVRAPND